MNHSTSLLGSLGYAYRFAFKTLWLSQSNAYRFFWILGLTAPLALVFLLWSKGVLLALGVSYGAACVCQLIATRFMDKDALSAKAIQLVEEEHCK